MPQVTGDWVRPQTPWARSAGVGHVAHQVFGEGAPDLPLVTDWGTNLDARWEEPSLTQCFHQFDARGLHTLKAMPGADTSANLP